EGGGPRAAMASDDVDRAHLSSFNRRPGIGVVRNDVLRGILAVASLAVVAPAGIQLPQAIYDSIEELPRAAVFLTGVPQGSGILGSNLLDDSLSIRRNRERLTGRGIRSAWLQHERIAECCLLTTSDHRDRDAACAAAKYGRK